MKKKTHPGVLTAEALENSIAFIKSIPQPEWTKLPFHCENYPKCKDTKNMHIHL